MPVPQVSRVFISACLECTKMHVRWHVAGRHARLRGTRYGGHAIRLDNLLQAPQVSLDGWNQARTEAAGSFTQFV